MQVTRDRVRLLVRFAVVLVLNVKLDFIAGAPCWEDPSRELFVVGQIFSCSAFWKTEQGLAIRKYS